MRDLGGWKWAPAVAGAKLHFIRATRLGGDWVRKYSMSSLLMVLRLKPSFADLMENKWARFTKFHNERKQQTLSGGAQTEQQGEQLDDKSDEAAPKAAPKAKGKAMPKPEARKRVKLFQKGLRGKMQKRMKVQEQIWMSRSQLVWLLPSKI